MTVTNVTTELRYAFYIAALSFIWLMLEYLVGLHDRYIDYHPVVTLFAILIPIVFMYLGMRRKRDVDYDGVITWKQLLISGLLITAFTAVLVAPLQYAFHHFINPHFFDDMINHAVERAVVNNRDASEARNEAISYFNLKSYVMQSVVGVLVLGTLLSLLYSFLLRRKESTQNVVVPEPAAQTPGP